MLNNWLKTHDSGANEPVFDIVGQFGTLTTCCGFETAIPYLKAIAKGT